MGPGGKSASAGEVHQHDGVALLAEELVFVGVVRAGGKGLNYV